MNTKNLSTCVLLAAMGVSLATAQPPAAGRKINIPTIDISGETERHVVVAAGTEEVYQGHPTTLLLPDGKTMFCVWTYGHGGPCGPMKRSDDGGRTWSDLLPVPDNWRQVRNCPAIYRLADPAGKARLLVFAGQGPEGTMQQSWSEDNGRTWTPMEPNGLVCVMPFCSIVPVDGGQRLLGMTNIRRPGETVEERSNVVAQSFSDDGGLAWSPWEVVLDIPGGKPCEPALIRSPDGKRLLCLIRENNRRLNSWKMLSDDEGRRWSEATQLPAALSGDRHAARYTADGRLVVVFRDTAAESPTRNHFVAWVGTYDDIVEDREGQYRAKLLDSHAGSDCGYPGLELLPDGTLVATTYVKYRPGPKKHSVVSVRFRLDELDAQVDRRTGGTILRGRLGRRYQANVQYLLELHEQHGSFMRDAYRLREHRKKDRDWDGEYAGKWLDAAARVAADTGHERLRQDARELAAFLRRCQAPDGYLGVDGQDQRGKSKWDVWNQWYAMTGLITCGESLGDAESLGAATRAARWLVKNYAPVDGPNHRFFRAAHSGGCNVDVCDQLLRIHAHAADEPLLEFARQVREHYPPIQQMRRSGKAHLMHPYVLLAMLGGLVELAAEEHNTEEMAWLESVWRDLQSHHLYPTGSLGLDEKLTADAPNDRPDGHHQETCATVEWLIFCRRLHLATRKPCYADAIEQTVCNALLAAQSEDGQSWTYFTPLRYEKRWFGGPTRCCYWSGPRGLAMLPELVYTVEQDGLRIELFEPSETVIRLRETPVRIVQTGSKVADTSVVVSVFPDRPAEFTLKVRIPAWSSSATVKANGHEVPELAAPGDYFSIRRVWSRGDRLELTFGKQTVIERMAEEGVVVVHGPEVLALDSRDNPGLDLDQVAIPAVVKLVPKAASGHRSRYAGRVRVGDAHAEAVFTPYADAGNESRFRTVFPPSS